MSIKKRLYLTNALILVLPPILIVLTSCVVYFAFVAITGIRVDPYNENFMQFSSASEFAENFNEENYNEIASDLSVYASKDQGIVVVYPDDLGSNIPALYSSQNNYSSEAKGFHAWIFYLLLLVAIAVAVTVLLTRFVFKSIMNPIGILTTGVHEIRDGNLAYRIDYRGKDEFAPVCEDFNDMASRLDEMVNQRLKDERNRRELIAGISHDLRTPLTSIKAYLEGLKKGVASTPEQEEKYLATIESKTENLEYIINQLFMFSKLDIGEFPLQYERVDICKELQDILSGSQGEYAKDGLDISYLGETQPIYCKIDTVLFENVIQNILNNSMKYKDSERVACLVSCVQSNGRAVITMADTGPGVSEANAQQLFEIFYREDKSRQGSERGSGIGLAIAQKIIEQLGGTIGARNGDASGLQITIELPLSGGEEDE